MGIRGVLRTMGDDMVAFHCPGCDELHMINTDTTARPIAPAWEFNGNYDAPTFSPSILVQGHRRLTDAEHARVMAGEDMRAATARTCHSFVRAGRIEFLSDCSHSLAGQTVPLQPIQT